MGAITDVQRSDEHSSLVSITDECASESATNTIGIQENKAVGFSRLLVVGVLVCTVTGAGVLTYASTRKVERRNFETEVCTE